MAVFTPALGSRVVITRGQSAARFLAQYRGHAKLEVFHSLDGSWQATPFTRASQDWSESGDLWTVSVPPGASEGGEFTFRAVHADGNVEWFGSEGGNGRIVVVDSIDAATPAPHTQVISHTLDDGQDVAFHALPLLSGPAMDRGLALERVKDSWLTPRLIALPQEVSEDFDTQLLLWRSADQQRAYALLPLTTLDVSTVIRRQGDKVGLRTQRDLGTGKIDGLAVMGEAGADQINELLQRMVSVARNEVGKTNRMPFRASEKHKSRQGLQFCTWNALGDWFNGQQAADIVQQLCKTDALFADALDAVIFDDGWQDKIVTNDGSSKRLRTFGAHEGFMPEKTQRPQGDSGFSSPLQDAASEEERKLDQLAGAIHLVRQRAPHKHIRIGVWLTLQGCWDGCEKGDSPIAVRFGGLVDYQHGEHGRDGVLSKEVWPLPRKEDWEKFWRSYFGDLKDAGVDFVKVDNQSWTTYAVDPDMRARMAHIMTRAAKATWGTDESVTHCMAMNARTLTGALGLGLLTDVEPVFRNSEDFFPDAADSHRIHIVWNVYNCLLSRHLSLTPDFDMFQSRHDWAVFHAVLRTFSPAPILLTDTPERHDPALVKQLLAPTKSGKQAVVQSLSDKPFPLFPFEDPLHGQRAVKLGLTTGNGAVIGLWNCLDGGAIAIDTISGRDLRAALGPRRQASSYGVYHQYSSRTLVVQDVEKLGDDEVLAALSLPQKAVQVISIVPMSRVAEGVTVGCVGLVDKLNPLVAVRQVGLAPASSTAQLGAPNSSTSGLASIPPPNVFDLLRTFRERYFDSSLLGRLRASPIRTLFTEIRFVTQALLTFATLLALHLFSLTSSPKRSALAADRMPLSVDHKSVVYEDEKPRAEKKEILQVSIDLAGELGFMCSPSSARDRLRFKIDGQVVDGKHVSERGEAMVVIDMIEAIKGTKTTSGSVWTIEVTA